MLLKNLINIPLKKANEIEIKDLALDSRKVKSGDLFFALKGSKQNGNKFIKHAIKRGARAIICSKKNGIRKTKIPIIKVKNVREDLANACKKFYKKKPKNIIAVTGTNGKSSVVNFYHQILLLNKISVASIGTLGIKKNHKVKISKLTSPDIISLHKELENIKNDKIDNVILEASSHGLHQGRLGGINFKAGIFTNFSQDHLDYHKTMKKYFSAKQILFSKLLNKNKYVITDRQNKEFKIIQEIAKKKKLKIITIDNKFSTLKDQSIKLIGSFQLKNLSMAILACKICGLSKKSINKKLKKIKTANGRLELIKTLPNKTKVFIDYAHTPDALSVAIQSLKKHFNKKVTLVFGCGGERDSKKRPLMAKIARNLCDKIYVTDDNPRNENAKKIRKSITRYLKGKNYKDIGNRREAIRVALNNSEPEEIILIAGKGHETSQDYGKKILNMSDKDLIKRTKTNKIFFTKKLIDNYYNSNNLKKVLNKRNLYKYHGVTINSKEVKSGNLFVAIKGNHNDGHEFIDQAIRNGANYCVTSKKTKIKRKKKIIKYSNTFNFLYKLAEEKRKTSEAKIIAITGSAGKTSVKNILGNLLSAYDNTYFSPRSFNNHFGVPLSLCNLDKNFKYGIFEIGMSNPGEINKLSKLVRPDIGVITNVAEAHIENFKNLKGIAKAKSEIINNINPGGHIVLNHDDKFYSYLKNIAAKNNINVVSFGKNFQSNIQLINVKKFKNKFLTTIKIFGKKITIESNNLNTYNILSSLAVIKILNLEIKKTLKIFKSLKPSKGRGRIYKVKRYKTNFMLVDESYNANPLSVKNALKNLSNIKKKNFKKYVLLGDMLELGYKSNLYHKNLSKLINNTDIDKVFVYGNKILDTFRHTKKMKQGSILKDKKNFDEVFSKLIKKNDYLMIKGSNATDLNKISNTIIKGARNVI